MRVSHRWQCLWPGLPQLWSRGCWWGLSYAVIFTVLVNFVLAATFLWSNWVDWAIVATGWIGACAVWFVFASVAVWHSPQSNGMIEEQSNDLLYREAQQKYLSRDWLEAESILEKLIRKDSLDIDAHMLMATIYRRTRRWDQSRRALRTLEGIERSKKWQLEIQQERETLNRLEQEARAERSEGFLEAA